MNAHRTRTDEQNLTTTERSLCVVWYTEERKKGGGVEKLFEVAPGRACLNIVPSLTRRSWHPTREPPARRLSFPDISLRARASHRKYVKRDRMYFSSNVYLVSVTCQAAHALHF